MQRLVTDLMYDDDDDHRWPENVSIGMVIAAILLYGGIIGLFIWVVLGS